jgi:DAK2 domain fusion protein YloV
MGAQVLSDGEVTMLDVLDASATRRWCSASLDALTAARRRMDDLNIFPVPDGDTGTNLGQTLGAASELLRATESADAAQLLTAMADGAARGARGNSGVILAHLLTGLARTAQRSGAGPIGAETFAKGLAAGAAAARAALAEPVDGTILSVADAAAGAALRTLAAQRSPGLAHTARAAAEAASLALDLTPSQLPALADAGVVDAGGLGLVLILDALVGVLTNEFVLRPAAQADASSELADQRGIDHRETDDLPDLSVSGPGGRVELERPRETGSEEFGYEVQYLLQAPESALAGLRLALIGLGDSLAVVAAGESLWNVHIHVNDVGAAIEAGLECGRPHKIAVTRFADQRAERLSGRPDTGPGAPRVAVVAVAPGEGLGHLFAGEGVAVVDIRVDVADGESADGDTTEADLEVGALEQAGRLSTLRADVVKAVLATRAAGVVLLVGAAVLAIAEAAADEVRPQGRDVAVISLRSPVQGLAALAVHDGARRFADDVAAMAEAAGATRCAEVIIADAAALTMIGWCEAGDAVGLIEGEVTDLGKDLGDVAAEMLERILAVGGELVTLLPGAEIAAGAMDALCARLARSAPHVELSVLPGGQAHPPLLLGVE